MWRKPTNPKPSSQALGEAASTPDVPLASAPAKSQTILEPTVASGPASTRVATPVPPPVPVLAAPEPRKVVAHDTFSPSSIGAGLKIRGELSGSSDLYIDGEAQGKITLLDSRVTVGPNGRVQADIEAREIIVEGSVQGNLKARENVRLGSSSKVEGSVLTPRIGIDDGAKLRGKVEMTTAGDPKPLQSHATSDKSAGSATLEAVATSSKSE
jgi:cytoskeletal protein CcmA (bactofilin family)